MSNADRPKGIVPLNKHPVLQDAYNVIQAIEACGASVPLTQAVVKAGDLLSTLQAMYERGDIQPLTICPNCGAEDSMEHFNTTVDNMDTSYKECTVCSYQTDPE